MKTLNQVQNDHVELVQNLPGYLYTQFELHTHKTGVDMSVRTTFDSSVTQPETEVWFNSFGVVSASCEKLARDVRRIERVKSAKLFNKHNIRRNDDRAELIFVVHLKQA